MLVARQLISQVPSHLVEIQVRRGLDDGVHALAEVVHDGDTGLLTKRDPAALAEAAIGLLIDSARRAAMSARARLLAEREFDVALQIDRTLEVYAGALAGRGRSAG